MSVNPRMITLAREAVGLTQNGLAHEAGISQSLISKIEHGLEDPQPEVLKHFAHACAVPVAFFSQQEELLGEGLVDIFHKKRLTLPAKPLRRANAVANIRRLEAVRLLRTVEFSERAAFPVFAVDEHESPEAVAGMVRATWRVPEGPLLDLTALIEATGIPVYHAELGHDKLSAISLPGVNGRHVIILNIALSASAQRFALAHELGHLVMHGGVASEDMEREADEFASALLMPADQIRPQLRGLRFNTLGGLKSYWRVSLAALIRRAHDLGGISDRQYRMFNIELNKLPGGRKREPGEFDSEKPRLMKYLLDYFRDELQYTQDELLRLMVITDEKFRVEYLGDTARKLRAVSPNRSLHSVPMKSGSL